MGGPPFVEGDNGMAIGSLVSGSARSGIRLARRIPRLPERYG
jgi:hypothetical protein